ncbi:MAG: signal peptidase I [Anaerolineae bacterium]|nr:signal peptidase I [Anaerolineae bacterium]
MFFLESNATQIQEPDIQDREEVSLGRAFGGQSPLRDLIETLVLTLVIFLIVNTLTGRFQVQGSSMEPALHNNQYLIVSKLSYRLGEPQRGDIVVFRPPNGSGEDYVKRVIGLPGELVEVRGGDIWIDGYRLEEPYIEAPMPYTGSWQLGAGEYFVLGDNRANSSDSHNWGVLLEDHFIGRAWISYWPPEHWGGVAHYRFPDLGEQE